MEKLMKNKLLLEPTDWIRIGIYAGLIYTLYASALRWLVVNDWERDGYSYCYLIPFVVLYLLWYKWSEFVKIASRPSWSGLFPFLLGLAFFWLGELGGEFLTLYLSMWLVVVGLCWMHFGWKKLKVIGFPLFFILTLFPLPAFLNTKIMLQLRLISSTFGVKMIQLYGLPVYREGNIIDLGFTQLQVVEACSGLHSLISLVVLCLLIIYFFDAHWWKRVFLLVSSVPTAILANSVRIAATAILYKYFGAEVAEGFFHSFSGLLIFVLCLPVLLIEMKILEKLPPRRLTTKSKGKGDGDPESVADGLKPPDGDTSGQQAGEPGGLRILQPVFITAVLLLVAMSGISSAVEFREKIPVKKSLSQFPHNVGAWTAKGQQKLDQVFIDVLDLNEYVVVDYDNRSGKRVNLYVAYYESQSKGQSIHSPATCLPGSGWSFDQSGTIKISDIPGTDGNPEINRAVMQMGSLKQISYYWFVARGRILKNAYQLKIYNFWDALTKQRTDGALVRLITKVYEDENIEAADVRLKQFVKDIFPVLEEHIPGKSI